MTTYGGVLLYGVGRRRREAGDEDPPPIEIHDLDDLERAAERLTLIIQTKVGGLPPYSYRYLHSPNRHGSGLLALVLPESPNAPHQDLSSGRFYARSGTGNRRLEQGEIDALYERRRRWDIDRGALLERLLRRNPLGYVTHDERWDQRAVLHVFASPVGTGPDLVHRAARAIAERPDRSTSEPEAALQFCGHESARRIGASRHDLTASLSHVDLFRPSPGTLGRGGWRWPTGRELVDPHDRAKSLVADVDRDGLVHVATAGAVYPAPLRRLARPRGLAPAVVDEFALAVLVAQSLAFAGVLCEAAGEHPPFDVGLAIQGSALQHAVSLGILEHNEDEPPERLLSFGEPLYTQTERIAEGVLGDPAAAVDAAERLLEPFIRTLGHTDGYPFGLIRP